MAIFQFLPVKEKTLLIRWDSFFVLNFYFHIHNSVCRFHFQSDHLSSQCFYKDLRASTKYDNQVKSRFIRNIIATQKTVIFLFLPVEDKTLLIWRDPLFVLNFLFYFLCGVSLEIQPQSDCLFRFVRHLEDLGVVVALRTFKGEDFSSVPQGKHGYWLGLLQLFEVNSPVSQLNLSSIVPTAIS